MTKQELWDWFSSSTNAHAERAYSDQRFFSLTTGLHPSRYRIMGDPVQIIEAQRKRMRGLEIQMSQMQRGYERKLKRELNKLEKQDVNN